MSGAIYTLEQAEQEIATLRGQVDKLTEVLTFLDMTSPGPNNPAAGSILYSLAGQAKYASSDGNDYNTGRMSLRSTGQTVSSTSDVVINGLVTPNAIGASRYRIYGLVVISANQTGGTASIAIHGPAVASGGTGFRLLNAGSTGVNWTNGGLASGGVAMSNGAVTSLEVFGDVTFSASGVLSLQAHTTIGADTFGVFQGCPLDIMPVT